ncbi:MAG TPA: trypsin-like peptidase domain-containing protein [Dokdonella sp.]|uniref:S1C family serine protease n=1 Tax=Dokdonella sp. TaxID=2291710 RepID=UPI002D7E5636|nr:trypsin-like peptidase domain-containing protein [Dokdonella sp.]HET9031673.1 trypsin-like peptidase domain-containing protein [Dokdonella sp.]
MRRATIRTLSFILRFSALGLALAFLVSLLAPSIVERLRGERASIAVQSSPRVSTPSSHSEGPVSYADAVSRAAPAVVSIYANKMTTVRQYRIIPDPVTRRLFGAIAAGPAYRKQEHSLGSGVVFSADGYVLTNNHVISGADDIQILLSDGRVSQARVIGADADTDLAVLKIDASDLPTIAVADRGDVNVGDVVLAIGNPFGVGKTVTMGIVSATGRQLRLSAYEDFIQTDAAINFGNSGGALVNALGELVGINTAVYRNAGSDPRNGGLQKNNAEGIGFAIPVSTAKAVLDQIISHGMVIRGWFGIEYADMSAISAATPSTTPLQRGVIVTEVLPGGPGDSVGLRRGDILLKLDGEDIIDQPDLRSHEAALAPGSVAKLDGLRNGVPFSVELTLMQRPQNAVTRT